MMNTNKISTPRRLIQGLGKIVRLRSANDASRSEYQRQKRLKAYELNEQAFASWPK